MSAQIPLLPKQREDKDLKPKGDQYKDEDHHDNNTLISDMKPLTEEAYGGGMYGHDDEVDEDETERSENTVKVPASDTQSADGPVETTVEPKHKPPPSTGDRDIDITGQSYIQ